MNVNATVNVIVDEDLSHYIERSPSRDGWRSALSELDSATSTSKVAFKFKFRSKSTSTFTGR